MTEKELLAIYDKHIIGIENKCINLPVISMILFEQIASLAKENEDLKEQIKELKDRMPEDGYRCVVERESDD